MDQEKPPPQRGRKPISKTGEVMLARPIRMTDAEWEKCKALGGAAWVREKINRAKPPKSGAG